MIAPPRRPSSAAAIIIDQPGYDRAIGIDAKNQIPYVRRIARSDEVLFETRPARRPPNMFAIPIEVKIHAVRCGTFSIVVKAGTATSKTPQPKPRKQPSIIKS